MKERGVEREREASMRKVRGKTEKGLERQEDRARERELERERERKGT